MTSSPLYHDPFAAVPPDVVAAIEEQCGLPFLQAVEKYGGKPVPCPDGTYFSIANPPGCGRAHYAAVAEMYRQVIERWAQQERARAVTKPQRQRKPRRPSIKTMIEQAERAAKPLASITLADGTKLDFGQPEPVKPDNPWPLNEFRTKGTKE